MKVRITYENKATEKKEYENIIESVCQEGAYIYGLDEDVELSVVLCDNAYIHELNKTYRNIDRPTDVLSFALNEGEEEGYDGPDTKLLGDIVISLDKTREQSEEYGHSFERELAYLTVHGMLHILGYDHMTDEDKVEMRKEEEFVLHRLGFVREGEEL